MKLAISNLAWKRKEDEEILNILKKYKIKKIEIAPSNVWPNLTKVSHSQINKYRAFWNRNGIEIVATTHLLSPYPELKLFESPKIRRKALSYLKKLVRISSILGAQVMNFGSPKNRRRGGLSNIEATNIAKDFFWEMAEECKKYDIKFAFEPNPTIYGTDFINKTKEAINLAKKVSHPNFGINIDLSTMAQNKEDYEETIRMAMPFAWHFHISEPGLKIIPQQSKNHKKLARVLRKLKYEGVLSVEMSLAEETNRPEVINKTLKFVTNVYGS